MKTIKTLLATAVAASAISAPAAMADVDVSASVGVATAYLWRGLDLGDGSPAVSGDLVVSSDGLYGGIWGSSGDDTNGNEYDLFVGYGTEYSGVSVDLSLWTYVYPDNGGAGLNQPYNSMGDLSEAILSVGYGPATVTYYDNVAGLSDYSYATFALDFGPLNITYGQDNWDDSSLEYGHLDLTYAYTDSLSFTLSQVTDNSGTDRKDNDLNFVVSYSLPIGE